MPNNDSLIIIIFGLISIIIIVGIYGVIGYKIYLRNNAKQLKDIADDYYKREGEIMKVMVDLVKYVDEFKKKNNI